MGEAKNRGNFEERKKQALELESQKEDESLRKQQHEREEQEILGAKLLAFAKSRLESSEPRLLQFTKSIEQSLTSKNYFSALIVALTLTDICCSMDNENRWTSGAKYAKWFKKYVGHHYISHIGLDQVETTFLSGEECFALRCSYLHKGTNNIEDEKIIKDYESKSVKIEFMAEMNSDCLKLNNILLLKLEAFCYRIIEGVNNWLQDSKGNSRIISHMREIPKIHTEGFSPIPGVFIGG